MVSPGDVQRLFLQAVLSRGILSAKLAQVLWSRCVAAVKAVDDDLDIHHSETREAWDAFLAGINRTLDPLDLEFRYIRDELSGMDMYALANRKGDQVAQIATDYTPAEIAYFKAVIDLIMTAPNEAYSVSSLLALREVHAVRPKISMSKTQAEVALGSFVAKGWLLKSKHGRYSLSTRSLIELNQYLESTYPDEVLKCTICHDIQTRGIACHVNNCQARMHYHCFASFRRRFKSCPNCDAQWPENAKDEPLVPVGEDASRGDDDFKQLRRHRSETNSDEEYEAIVDDNESATTQSQSQSQSQNQVQQTQRGKNVRKGKGKN